MIKIRFFRKSLGNPKLFTIVKPSNMCNLNGYLKGTLNVICTNVGGNYDNDANAGVFNVNVNNSSSNTNTNNGSHHRGIITAFKVPCHLAEIHNNSWQMNNLPTPYHEAVSVI